MIFVSQKNLSDTRTIITIRIGCRLRRRIYTIMFDKETKVYNWHGCKKDRQLNMDEVSRLRRAMER